MVSRRQQKAGAGDSRGGADQRLQIFVGFADRMRELAVPGAGSLAFEWTGVGLIWLRAMTG